MKTSEAIFIFTVFDWNYPLYWKYAPETKIVCWSWNLESSFFEYVELDGNFHFFSSEIYFLC